MTISDYNEYIKNYLENDNTKSAVMLTASWGAGKSYYIREELVPFVKEKLNKMCVCVSLYGLKNIDEVSKALYLEVRFGKFDILFENYIKFSIFLQVSFFDKNQICCSTH